VVGRIRGEIAPALEVVRQEITRIIRGNDVRVPGVNQGKRASRSANVHRLPEAIEDQNLTV